MGDLRPPPRIYRALFRGALVIFEAGSNTLPLERRSSMAAAKKPVSKKTTKSGAKPAAKKKGK
jgi:hypothetical protein